MLQKWVAVVLVAIMLELAWTIINQEPSGEKIRWLHTRPGMLWRSSGGEFCTFACT